MATRPVLMVIRCRASSPPRWDIHRVMNDAFISAPPMYLPRTTRAGVRPMKIKHGAKARARQTWRTRSGLGPCFRWRAASFQSWLSFDGRRRKPHLGIGANQERAPGTGRRCLGRAGIHQRQTSWKGFSRVDTRHSARPPGSGRVFDPTRGRQTRRQLVWQHHLPGARFSHLPI